MISYVVVAFDLHLTFADRDTVPNHPLVSHLFDSCPSTGLHLARSSLEPFPSCCPTMCPSKICASPTVLHPRSTVAIGSAQCMQYVWRMQVRFSTETVSALRRHAPTNTVVLQTWVCGRTGRFRSPTTADPYGNPAVAWHTAVQDSET